MRCATKKLPNIALFSNMIPKIVVTTTYNFVTNAGKIVTYTKNYEARVNHPLSVDEVVYETINSFANGPVKCTLEVATNSLNNPNDFEM